MPAPKTGTKRARGSGSIRLRRRTGQGQWWQIRWEVGVGENRVYRSETVGPCTKTEAEERLREHLSERSVAVRSGRISTDPRLTVGEWLRCWLDVYASGTVRPRTLEGYRHIVERHLIPGLGSIRLNQLGMAEVQAFVNERRKQGDTAQWIRHVHGCLRIALTVAEKHGLVSRNAAKLVEISMPSTNEVRPLTPEQARAFLAFVRGDRLEALYATTMALGLRKSEALGLQWSDVDLDQGTLTVRQSLQRYDGEYHLDDVKTRRSRRTLMLPAPLVEVLRAHRVRQLEERLVARRWRGDEWNLVFCREDGYPLNHTVVATGFADALRAAGLPHVRFHDLRHGAATYLLAAGVSMRTVMETLGHSQMATTSDLYSHVLPELQREASERIAATLWKE